MALAGAIPATAGASSGLAPVGEASVTPYAEVETLANYKTKGKIKLQRRVRFLGVCTVECDVTVEMTLVIPGPNLVSEGLTGHFPAGQIFEGYLKLTKQGLAFLKENKGKSKFRTSYQAVDPLTGNTDTDARTFKFK